MKKIILIYGALFFSGCSLINTVAPPNYDQLGKSIDDFKSWQKSQEILFERYLGEPDSNIKSLFGDPFAIHRSPQMNLPDYADELWIYKSVGIGNSVINDFYFKDHRLVKVLPQAPQKTKTQKVAQFLNL